VELTSLDTELIIRHTQHAQPRRAEIEDRRQFVRLPSSVEMRGNLVPWIPVAEESHSQFLGETENVGRGGVCVVSDTPVPENSVLRCEVGLPGTSVGVPTLMQVRWVSKAADSRHFRVGLQFLL
jgi:hypothetical protein